MNSDFKDLLRSLNAEGVEYLIIGGYALMEYAEPRFTKDLDIWIMTSPLNSRRVLKALREFGAPVHEMTEEDLSTPGWVFQIGVAPIRIDILTSANGVEFEDAWDRRTEVRYGDVNAWVISKQDLIANKLATGRPQDLVDVQTLQGDQGS